MRTIHKFPVKLAEKQVIAMPRNADILCMQIQYGTPHIWAAVEDTEPFEERVFYLSGTGHELPRDAGPSEYVGTWQEGPYVWHLFAKQPGVLAETVSL